MAPLDFKLHSNIAGREGVVEGYFVIQTHWTGSREYIELAVGEYIRYAHGLDRAVKVIPVVTDEQASGPGLMQLARPSMAPYIAGILSFGRQATFSAEDRYTSHLDVVSGLIVPTDPNFLTAVVEKPAGQDYDFWRGFNDLSDMHFPYGQLSVGANDCQIKVMSE